MTHFFLFFIARGSAYLVVSLSMFNVFFHDLFLLFLYAKELLKKILPKLSGQHVRNLVSGHKLEDVDSGPAHLEEWWSVFHKVGILNKSFFSQPSYWWIDSKFDNSSNCQVGGVEQVGDIQQESGEGGERSKVSLRMSKLGGTSFFPATKDSISLSSIF